MGRILRLGLAVFALYAAGVPAARAQRGGPPDERAPAQGAGAQPAPSPAPPADPAIGADIRGEEPTAIAARELRSPQPLRERVADFLASDAERLAAWRAAARAGDASVVVHPDTDAAARARELVAAGWSGGRVWLLERAERLWPEATERARQRRALLDAALSGPVAEEDAAPLALHLARAANDLPATKDDAARWIARAEQLTAAAQDRAGSYAARVARAALDLRFAGAEESERVANAVAELEAVRAADDAGAARAVAARLSFDALEREHARALAAHYRRAPDAPAVEHPTIAIWPRVVELASHGIGPARWWLVTNAPTAVADPLERRALQRSLLELIVREHADEAWLVDAIRVAGALTAELGADAVRSLGERLLASSANLEVRAWTQHQLATSLADDRGDPTAKPRALALLAALRTEQPNHRLARAADGLAFELRHLGIGSRPPDVVSSDVDGREVRLSHTRGLVTAVFFWGQWSPASVALARELVILEQCFADAPFVVLGVVTDADADEYHRARAAIGAEWVDAWQGSPAGPWPTAWGVREFPRLFLLDADGRVRHRDLDGIALTTAARRLVREVRPGYEPLEPGRPTPPVASAPGTDRPPESP